MTAGPAPSPRRPSLPPLLADTLLAVTLTLLIVAESAAEGRQPFTPVLLLMTVPLAWRRQQPLLVFGLVALGAVFGVSAAQYVGLTAVMISAYSVGAYCTHRLLSLGVLLATATAVLSIFGGQLPRLPDFSGPYVVLLPFWLIGNAIRTRQLRADAFEHKATRLEQEQEAATQAAMAEERARIARELHDVVAHSVSVMVVQAGAARHIVQTSPVQATEALRAVEATGHEAMTELRRLLGVLSHNGQDISLAPQPGVEQLPALVRRVGDAGLPVRLHIEGRPRPLPPGINLTIYRIVQEALTNALKYAGLAPTEVILDYRAAELKVEILDEGSGPAVRLSGEPCHGLAGMRERVALYGGRLEAGPRLERGYAVRAWLPLESSL